MLNKEGDPAAGRPGPPVMRRNRKMKASHILFSLLLAAATCAFPAALDAETDENIKLTDAASVLRDIMAIREKSIPAALFSKAYGIAVIPNVIKVGFIVGGRHGLGVMCQRNEDMTWSNPFFLSLSGGSIGWQAGAQSADIVLVFKSRRSLEGLLKGKFTLGADAAVAAGPVGRQAEAGTDIQLKAEIYSYARSRGLFAGLAVEGSVLQLAEKANAAYYGSDEIGLKEILAFDTAQLPAAGAAFRGLLAQYSGAATD
jgi:lipid-binding SYLF domain-containing protein